LAQGDLSLRNCGQTQNIETTLEDESLVGHYYRYRYSDTRPPRGGHNFSLDGQGRRVRGSSGPGSGELVTTKMSQLQAGVAQNPFATDRSLGPAAGQPGKQAPSASSQQWIQGSARPTMTNVANPPVQAGNVSYGPSYSMSYQPRSTADKSAVKYSGFLPLEGTYRDDDCRIG